jgi:cbb3-type cytochrome oxidase subunit 3
VFTLEQTILIGLLLAAAVYFSYRKGQKDMVEFATAKTLEMLEEHDHIRVKNNVVQKVQDVVNEEIITYVNESRDASKA